MRRYILAAVNLLIFASAKAQTPNVPELPYRLRWHLHLLQKAMGDAGFRGLHTEWWHFVIAGWQKYLPPEELKHALQLYGMRWQGQL